MSTLDDYRTQKTEKLTLDSYRQKETVPSTSIDKSVMLSGVDEALSMRQPVEESQPTPGFLERRKSDLLSGIGGITKGITGGLQSAAEKINIITDPIGSIRSDLGQGRTRYNPVTLQFEEVTKADELQEARDIQERSEQQIDQALAPYQYERPKFDSTLANIGESVSSGVAQSVAQFPFMLGGAGGLAPIGLSAYRQKQTQLAEEGASPVQAELGGIASAGVEVATEFLPFKNLEKITLGKGQAGDIAKQVIEETLGEGISQAFDPYIDFAAIPDNELPGLKEQVINATEAGLTGGATALLFGGAGSSIASIRNKSQQALANPTQENVFEALEEIKTNIPEVAQQIEDQEIIQEANPNKMSLEELKNELNIKGLDTTGSKSELRNRVKENRGDISVLPMQPSQIVQEDAETVLEAQLQADTGISSILEQSKAKEFTSEQEIDAEISELEKLQDELQTNKTVNGKPFKGTLPMNLQLFAERIAELRELKQSKFFGSIMKSSIIPQNIKNQLNSDLFLTERITNEQTLEDAQKSIDKNMDKAVKDYLQIDNPSPKDIATGIDLLRRYANNNDIDMYNRISRKAAELATKSGQVAQSNRILQLMTPEGYLQHANNVINKEINPKKQKQVDDIVNKVREIVEDGEADKINRIKRALEDKKIKNISTEMLKSVEKGQYDKFLERLYKQYDMPRLTNEQSSQILDLIKQSQGLEGRQRDIAIAQANQIISNVLPSTMSDKFATLQRISMLLNFKTQARNVLGNVLMQGAELGKEAVRMPIDIATSKITGERTATPYELADFKKGYDAFKRGFVEAWEDYQMGINTRKDRGQFEIQVGKVFPEQGPLKAVAKGLNKANDLTSFLLSAGDRPFFEATFEIEKNRALRDGKDVLEAEEIAQNEAEERTFQNRSWLADTATSVRNKFGVFGRAVLPYSYTPSNITDKVFDYTPVGLSRTIGKNIVSDIKNGQFNQKQFTDRLSRNLTGTALIMLGYALAKQGVITGAYDEDKDAREFQKQIGMQDYAFKAGDKQITFDWAQPIAVPFAIGANMHQAGLSEEEARESLWDALSKASLESSTTLLEQPLLTGIQQLFGGYGSEGIQKGLVGTALDIPTQVVPGLSLARSIRQFQDPVQRQIDYDNPLQSLRNSIPWLSQGLPAKYSTLGTPREYYQGSDISRFGQALLSPAYISEEQPTPIEQEILNVYNQVGDNQIFPKVSKNFTYQGERIELSQEELSAMQKEMGTYVQEMLTETINNPSYESLSMQEKNAIIKAIIDDGYNLAKTVIVNERSN